MKCPNCHSPVDAEQAHCPYCYASLGASDWSSTWVLYGLVTLIVVLLVVIASDRFGNLGILAWVLEQIRPQAR